MYDSKIIVIGRNSKIYIFFKKRLFVRHKKFDTCRLLTYFFLKTKIINNFFLVNKNY